MISKTNLPHENVSLKKLQTLYTNAIISNCVGANSSQSGLYYWQNRLFASILMYLLPLSLFAIVPSILVSMSDGLYFLVVFDAIIFLLLLYITFSKRLSTFIRKTIFISILYLTALTLLYFLGSYGPGLLYLMSVTIFTILIFKRRVAYWTVVINVFICIGFGTAIHFNMIETSILSHRAIGPWIAISSNLILLCSILAALLPTIFKGLQTTIEDQQKLKLLLKIEQRSLEKTLQTVKDKNKELEEFAYMTSHDLQEPLRIVTGFLSLLEKNSEPHLDEKSHQYLNFAKEGAERMKTIISDLLDYSLAEKKTYTVRQIDTNSLMEEYAKQNEELFLQKKVTFNWKDLPVIEADKLSVQHLFQNLLGNALKYQKEGTSPAIQISHRETKRHWQFAVSDNGIGIATPELEKVFIAFKRLHTKSEYPGTGIGLAICKKIIENHKGKIWVESEPDKGSTFYFTISKNLS